MRSSTQPGEVSSTLVVPLNTVGVSTREFKFSSVVCAFAALVLAVSKSRCEVIQSPTLVGAPTDWARCTSSASLRSVDACSAGSKFEANRST